MKTVNETTTGLIAFLKGANRTMRFKQVAGYFGFSILMGIASMFLYTCSCNTVSEDRRFRNDLFVNENWYMLTTDEKSYKDCPTLVEDKSTVSVKYENWLLRFTGDKAEKRKITKKIKISSGIFNNYAVNGKIFTTIEGFNNGNYWWDGSLYNPESDDVEYVYKGNQPHSAMGGMGSRYNKVYGWEEKHLLLIVQATNYKGKDDPDHVHNNYKGRVSPFFVLNFETGTIKNLDMMSYFPELQDSVVWYDLRLINNKLHGLYYNTKDSTIEVVTRDLNGIQYLSKINFPDELSINRLDILKEYEKYIGIFLSGGSRGTEAYYISIGEWVKNNRLIDYYDNPWDSVIVIDDDKKFGFYDGATGDSVMYPPISKF